MKAQIQHTDKSRSRLILQALVPFLELKDSVLFTYRTNTNGQTGDKRSQYEASMQFYQRRVDEKRSDEIKAFIRKSILQERDGRLMATLFPTSMILALTGDSGDEGENRVDIIDDEHCEVVLRSNVFIVDGQHRMMGMIKLYEELDRMIVRTDDDDYVYDYLKDYKFNCTILVNYDLWEQGQVFVNVNFKQKPVNKSLYYEVFGSEYREDSQDDKRNQIYMAHCLVKELNEQKNSPRRVSKYISASASRMADGTVNINLANADLRNPQRVTIDLADIKGKVQNAQILTSADIKDYNDFGRAEKVHPAEFKKASINKQGQLVVEMPTKSIVCLQIK